MLGHVGKEKLADRISAKAYVADLGNIIKRVTEQCGRCIQNATRHHKPRKSHYLPCLYLATCLIVGT